MERYRVKYSKKAKQDVVKHYKSGDKTVIKNIEKIILELSENPFIGVGKPEQLKYNNSVLWSRRIDKKNRIVYSVNENDVIVYIVSAKGHYNDK